MTDQPTTLNPSWSVDPNEGRKDDGGKDRIELVPPELIFAVARVLTFGAQKYADRNWEKGMSWGRVFGALMRHMWAWWGGKAPTSENFVMGNLDGETRFSHLWHAGCCLSFLIAYEERKAGTDDRFQKEEKKLEPIKDDKSVSSHTRCHGNPDVMVKTAEILHLTGYETPSTSSQIVDAVELAYRDLNESYYGKNLGAWEDLTTSKKSCYVEQVLNELFLGSPSITKTEADNYFLKRAEKLLQMRGLLK